MPKLYLYYTHKDERGATNDENELLKMLNNDEIKLYKAVQVSQEELIRILEDGDLNFKIN